jgi:hypothetical protein
VGQCWANLDGDQLMDIEDEGANTLSESIIPSSLPIIALLVKSLHWTIVVPLPTTIMELNELASNVNPLNDATIAFLVSHTCLYANLLKVLSCGNYLLSLTVCMQQVDFDGHNLWERNMDDLILKMAIWQDTLSVKYEQTGDWLV